MDGMRRAIAGLVAVLIFLSGSACGDKQVRVPDSAWSPLPDRLDLVMRDEVGLNGAGDEVYLTYLLVASKGGAEASDSIRELELHLTSKGYKINAASEDTRWASASGRGPEGTVQVGTADRYLTDSPITEVDVPDKFKAKIGDADPAHFVVAVFEP
jgi:hypothetical protein